MFKYVSAKICAKLAYILYRLKVLDYDTYDVYIDKLQLRLFQDYLDREEGKK